MQTEAKNPRSPERSLSQGLPPQRENLQDDSTLLSPLDGPVIPLETVPDPVFAQKIVGPGIAIDPISDRVLSPCAGKITQLHRCKHAVAVQRRDGLEILIHVGIDTVKLNGEGFTSLVTLGEQVSAGQPLLRFDSDLVARQAKSLISVMLVTNRDEAALEFPFANKPSFALVTAGKDPVIYSAALKGGENDDVSPGGAQTEPKPSAESASSSPVTIENLPTGLHARPAALLANLAKSFHATLEIIKATKSANAKSVVGIMSLEISPGDQVYFKAEGAKDATEAVQALARFLRELREEPPAHDTASVSSMRAKVATNASVSEVQNPNTLIGVGVSAGLAIGRVHFINKESFSYEEKASGSIAIERETLHHALSEATEELRSLMHEMMAGPNKAEAAIFGAHLELLDDPDLLGIAYRFLEQGRSAAFAWDHATSTHAERLSKLSNELMANRANDLRDVGRRVLRRLTQPQSPASESQDQRREKPAASQPISEIAPGSILIAESLTPSETVQLDRSRVVGFCTTTGGATSHVAILARSLGLPAIAGIDERALGLAPGTEVLLDGESGELRLQPTAAERKRAETLQRAQGEQRESALKLAHQAARTRDGRAIEVAANIGSIEDARQAVAMGADGVGLLRSEFLFLERDTAPSEDEQWQVYQQIADVLGERTLVIRTLDVGGDKPLKYLPLGPEENPFLGVRGIRVGFQFPEILRSQLRAILRVRSQGKLCVMFPMIASIEELRAAKAILAEEIEKLGSAALALGDPNSQKRKFEVGIMIEVPAAALAADELARESDFFSIGTNDLTQYTLAMDRGHRGLARQVDALHPAVLKLMELATQAAHRHGKWIGVCGGLASDLKAIPILLGLGIDELSVSIPSIPMVKSGVRNCSSEENQKLASRAVHAKNANEVHSLLSTEKKEVNT